MTTESPAIFTCITCRVSFLDADLQREHYKAEWHRYNLKRKVAQMPPVTAKLFEEKLNIQRGKKVILSADKEERPCEVCNKPFNSTNAYNNHIQSKKHAAAVLASQDKESHEVKKLNAKNVAGKVQAANKIPASVTKEKSDEDSDDEDWEDVEDDSEAETSKVDWGDVDGEAISVDECLFCAHKSPCMESSLLHMTSDHSFFLPDLQYMDDLYGMVEYLGEKIGLGHVCLWCNEKGKGFHSTQSVQKHMRDKGHCKLLFHGDAVYEYADFYDYSTSYPDNEKEHDAKSEICYELIDGDGFELKLPASGAVIGHRSLMRYYKQNVMASSRSLATRSSGHMPNREKILTHYRALGWTGATGPAASRRAADMKFVKRFQQKNRMQLGVKANKLQKHIRSQVFFN